MAKPDKAAKVAELTDQFSNSAAAVLTEYRGLTVKDLKTLRRSLGENASYAVAKSVPNACIRWVSGWTPNPGSAAAPACRTCAR